LTLPLTGCVEDFHLLVVLQPPQLRNSASHGATRHARRTQKKTIQIWMAFHNSDELAALTNRFK
ncbi:hypothetical protein ACP80H_21675, partial [Escherichia coli]